MQPAHRTILIVDDQEETGDLLARILHYLGHDAVHVQRGADAIEFARRHHPDAVLLDYMMPDMDGLAVLRELRKDPNTRGTPIIMFSADNDPNVVEKAMRQGASAYWVKASLRMDELSTRLNQFLERN